MKKIKPFALALVGPGEDSFKTAGELDETYKENTKNIIFAASHIENYLAMGITKYFFGDNYEMRKMLDDMIVSTDFFSFSAKRKTFLTIVKLQKIVEGRKFSDLEKSISRIIKYRNMFTHGTVVYTGASCILHYFEGCKIEKEVDDALLDKIEKELNDCLCNIEEIVQDIKQIKA